MPIALGFIIIGAALLAVGAAVWCLIELSGEHYEARHQAPEPGPGDPTGRPGPDHPSGPRFGTIYAAPVAGHPPWELKLERPAGPSPFPPPGEWNRANAATGADAEHRTPLWNGHTFGCLVPDEDHLGACPEEGDWPDDHAWPVPDLPPDIDLADPGAGAAIALAIEADAPEDAGWTGPLLAELRTAPTVLDHPAAPVSMSVWRAAVDEAWEATEDAERLADTGEIQLASQRADYVADLSAQDADAAEFRSRLASTAAEIRLSISVK